MSGVLARLKTWWRLRVFKAITIRLSGPICDCDEQDLGWDVTNGPGLRVFCETRGVELKIPNKRLRANFSLDVKYPGKRAPDKSQAKSNLVVLNGGADDDDEDEDGPEAS